MNTFKYLGVLIFILLAFTQQTQAQNNYANMWKQYEQAIQKGKNRDALEIAQKIFETSKKENKVDQKLKALIHIYKNRSFIEEKSEELIIQDLKSQIDNSTSKDEKALLKMLLAHTYNTYYSSNRYKIEDRTLSTELSKDFTLWDARQFQQQISGLYLSALNDGESLKDVPLDAYSEIIQSPSEKSIKYQTFYDVLVHTAAQYFSQNEYSKGYSVGGDQSSDVENEIYEQQKYLVFWKDFLKQPIQINSQSSKDQIFQSLIQKWLIAHQNDNNDELLGWIDDYRLDQTMSKVWGEEKSELYLNILQQNVKTYQSQEAKSLFAAKSILYNFQQNEDNPNTDLVNIRKSAQEHIKKYPKTYGSDLLSTLIHRIETKELSISLEQAIYPNTPFKVFTTYRNVSTIHYKLFEGDLKDVQLNQQKIEDRWKELNKMKLVRSSKINLTGTGDFKSHAVEIPLKGIESGHYVIVFYTDGLEKDFSKGKFQYAQLYSTGLSSTIYHNGENYVITVLDRKTGHPVQAQVELIQKSYLKKDSTVLTQLTNQKGEVLFPTKNMARNASYDIILKKGNDVYPLQSGISMPYRDQFEQNSWNKKIKIFTDRAIYRPGQQVFFKGVLTESKLDTIRTLGQQEVNVRFVDVNYREISKQTFTTNEMGSFAGFFRIPEGLLAGSFSIESDFGSESIQVEEYKRPTFEVKSVPIESAYQLGDTIPYKGQAIAYSGANISNATVKYIIERSSYYPFWRKSRIWPPYPRENKVIATGTTTTDENGFFNIPFVALSGKDDDANYQYTITVDVIDISGETRFLNDQIHIGKQSVQPSLEVNSIWEVGQNQPFKLGSKNLQNQDVESTFQVKILPITSTTSLKKPKYWSAPDQFLINKANHDKVFPYDFYKSEEEDFVVKKGKAVWSHTLKVKGDSILNILPKNLNAGFYQLQAILIEGKDTLVVEQTFEVRKQKNITAEKTFIQLHLDKNEYQAGDLITATFISDYPKAYLTAQVFHKNKVIASHTTTFDGRVKEWKIPVTPEMIGDVALQYTVVAENRIFNNIHQISIPFPKKETLKYEWTTFRNKLLPGANETWKLKIKDTTGRSSQIELLATMYDASLDQFLTHNFNYSHYLPTYARYHYTPLYGFRLAYPIDVQGGQFYTYSSATPPIFSSLNFYDWSLSQYRYPIRYMAKSNAMGGAVREESAIALDSSMDAAAPQEGSPKISAEILDELKEEKGIVFRKNFNETAFFYPQLRADNNGEYTIEFTAPEALTTWKFLAFAHTPDLNYAIIKDEVVTQKDVMVQLNKPRFVRMGDELYMKARISNLTGSGLSTTTKLVIRDASTNEDITAQVVKTSTTHTIDVAANSNSSVEWFLHIPNGLEGIIYEVSTVAGNHTDGESDVIPVLENRILLTESFPVFYGKKGKHDIDLSDFVKNSSTSTTQSITFEYTSQPVWHALMALPYLNEDKNASATAIFNRFYAHALASYILKIIPESQKLLDAWKKEGSLKSALEKNQDLKSVVLEATPWLRDAQDETEQMQNLYKLLSDAQDDKNTQLLLQKLRDLRSNEGGICWYPGMPSNRYITQNVLIGLLKLQQLGAYDYTEDEDMRIYFSEALEYLKNENQKAYDQIKRSDSNFVKNDHLSPLESNYLYLLSFVKGTELNEAQKYFYNQSKKFVFQKDLQTKAALAIVLHRWNDSKLSKEVLNAIQQSAVVSKTEGMYWKSNTSYYWYHAPIETQALVIEAFQQISNDKNTIDQLKTWLLRQKQTSRWAQPKATVEAVYALLLTGGDWKTLSTDIVKFDKKEVANNNAQMGTGYIKTTWNAEEAPKNIFIQKKSKSPSWGAVYHQYYENIAQVKASSKDLQVSRTLYKVVNTSQGETLVPLSTENVQVGDKIRVKLELKFDRDVEFFHLQDTRGSGLEPASVLSGYKYQGGLGYYEMTTDVATHWYMDFVPKGNYILEYTVYANVSGKYSSGVTFGECLYAPEFRFHSNGSMIEVKN